MHISRIAITAANAIETVVCGHALVYSSLCSDTSDTSSSGVLGKYFRKSSGCVKSAIDHLNGRGVSMKGQRRANGGFERAEAPSHLIRRCHQYFSDLYAHEPGSSELTKQQFTVLAALENNEGVSQTGACRNDRHRPFDAWQRWCAACWSAVSIPRTYRKRRPRQCCRHHHNGRKGLKPARTAAERAEQRFLEALPPSDRGKFIKSLVGDCHGGREFATNGAASPGLRFVAGAGARLPTPRTIRGYRPASPSAVLFAPAWKSLLSLRQVPPRPL